MELDPIFMLVVLATIGIMVAGTGFGVAALCLTSTLGASAAIKMPALGGASIPPAPLVAIVLLLAVMLHSRLRHYALCSLRFPRPGFWVLSITIYSVLTAILLPRLFAGTIDVFSLTRTAGSVGVIREALAPRPGNLTQAGYMIVGLAAYVSVAAYAARDGAFGTMRILLATTTLLLVFVALDLFAYLRNMPELLAPIRNANYRMLDSGSIGGLKRIVGSFPEASAYSQVAIGFLGFCLMLWLEGLARPWSALLALLLAVTLVFSTSTTAYSSLLTMAILVYVATFSRLVRRTATDRHAAFAVVLPVGMMLLLVTLPLIPAVSATVYHLYDATVVGKLGTQSGVERMRWNSIAFKVFLDTGGLGAGTGSVRASSLPVAILASIGLPGLCLFAALAGSLIAVRRSATVEASIGRAAGWACLALGVAACFTAGTIDLGLYFSIFAALSATAGVVHRRAPNRPTAVAGIALSGSPGAATAGVC